MVVWLILYIFLICATILDCRSGRIPNILIGTALLIGAVLYGRSSCQELFLYGVRVVLFAVPFMIFFCLRMLGGGDVKVIAIIGGFVGVRDGMIIIFLSLLIAAIASFVKMIHYGILKERMRILIQYIDRVCSIKKLVPYPVNRDYNHYKLRLSLFFSFGSFLYCIYQYGDFLWK